MPSLPTARQQPIELYGAIGSFSAPGLSIQATYFSTSANARASHTHEEALLRLLLPMRERVSPREIRDLNALLQRDLNDARVAHELVPYLKGATPSGIAFFPAILAALIPKGFIEEEGDGHTYPSPEDDTATSGNRLVRYGDYWTLEVYRGEDGTELPLGALTLYPSRTNVIVLDGQHRANAFRFVSGVFGRGDDVYSAFYHNVDRPEHFDADLPVTLIWFRSEAEPVQPTFISRNLFVDVNTNAKKVSASRNILLDDRHVPALVTRFFLSQVAEDASFEPGRFSLLHSGFDLDSDLADKAGHVFTLTNPELIEYVASWLLLGSRGYNSTAKTRVSREHAKTNFVELEAVFADTSFSPPQHVRLNPQTDEALVRDPEALPSFERAYREVLHPVLYGLFNEFALLRLHYEACEAVATWRDGASTTVREVWDQVFNGGEGLYYALQYYGKNRVGPGDRLGTLLEGVAEIERCFEQERADRFSSENFDPDVHLRRVNQTFDSVRTKAFHVGLFMALDEWKGEDSFLDSYEAFLRLLNETCTPEQWVYLLNEVRRELIKGVDPRTWPTYQNLIYRVIQREDGRVFFNEANFFDSPDGVIFRNRIRSSFNAWLETEDILERPLEMETLGSRPRSWGIEAKDYVDELMAGAGLRPLEVDSVALAKEVVEQEIKTFNKA